MLHYTRVERLTRWKNNLAFWAHLLGLKKIKHCEYYQTISTFTAVINSIQLVSHIFVIFSLSHPNLKIGAKTWGQYYKTYHGRNLWIL